MKEITAILTAYDSIDPTVTKAALATVVRVEGSSYRRTGARMLIMDDGRWVGGISGGCLEGDALKRARLAIAQAKPTLITYDTTDDDDYQIGVGLGCNGVIDVLISPIAANQSTTIQLLKQCVAAPRQMHVLLTVTHLPTALAGLSQGDMLYYTGAESLQVLEDATIIDAVEQIIRRYVSKGKSAPAQFELTSGQTIELFIEVIPPIPHVVLMGQQYDVYPLIRIINELGWQATVVANPQKVTRTMFATANALVPPDQFSTIPIDDQTAIILMAHDYKTDKANLPKALETTAPLVGMLGPRVRSEKIYDELRDDGLFDQETDRIHAPVGLDIGAASPEEIALSIVAEIRATLSRRDGSFLRNRPAPIHERE